MAAEAENEINGPTGKAIGYMNEVRNRANATPFLSEYSQASFRGIIQDERSRELSFEGWRRLDLIRWGIFVSTMNELVEYVNLDPAASAAVKTQAFAGARNVSEIHNFLPIPTRELSLNKLLTQNQGW